MGQTNARGPYWGKRCSPAAKAEQGRPEPSVGVGRPSLAGHDRQRRWCWCGSLRAGWSAALQPPPSERWRRRPRARECSQRAVFTKHAKTDRGAMIDKHSASASARGSERARSRDRSGVPCAAWRTPPTPMRAYPPRCARVSRRPPTRDVPSRSQPAHHPACARTSTHLHVRVRGTSSPDSRDVTRLAPVRPSRSAEFTSQQRT